MLLALELLQHLSALRLPDALADDVLCSLGCNASELLGLQVNFHIFTKLHGGVVFSGVFQ